MTYKTPTAWKGPQPTAVQISRWISDRRREGATLKIENSEVDGALMSFQCAYDSDGVLYDWFPAEPAEPAERNDDDPIGDATPANRQRRRRHRLAQAATIAGYGSIDQLAAAIISGEAKIS